MKKLNIEFDGTVYRNFMEVTDETYERIKEIIEKDKNKKIEGLK